MKTLGHLVLEAQHFGALELCEFRFSKLELKNEHENPQNP